MIKVESTSECNILETQENSLHSKGALFPLFSRTEVFLYRVKKGQNIFLDFPAADSLAVVFL